jgi:DNA-binding LacI/PurR family transcriptional regulator
VESIYQELANGSIDGLVIQAPPHDPLVDRLAASPLPVVAIVDAIPALPSVVVDDMVGSSWIVEYLLARGHRHILYRTSPPRLSLASVQRRRAAFVEAAEARGLEVMEWAGEEQTDAHDPTLYPCLDRARDARPTAAVCWNDRAAYDMLAHCLARGLRVPEDCAIVGFDGIGTPLESIWKLTTVRAPWAQVAQTAIKLLVAQIGGERIAQETVLPVELICGNTA